MNDREISTKLSATSLFGFDVFRQCKEDQSFVISPQSITLLLGMVANGANEKTQEEIMTVLCNGELSIQELNAVFKRLRQKQCIYIQNSITHNERIAISDEYANTIQDVYKASITKNSNTDWVDLTNIIKFTGSWRHSFDKANTKLEPFHNNRYNIDVHMMKQHANLYYMSNEEYMAVDLPFDRGYYCMRFILPINGNDIENVARRLNREMLQYISSQMNIREVDLSIPKFRIDTEVNLNKAIQTLGISLMFDYGKADFSNMSKTTLFVSNITQQAYIDVNEEGTNAASVTSCSLEGSGTREPPKRVEFHANSPFIYLLMDEYFGTVVFLGQFIGK